MSGENGPYTIGHGPPGCQERSSPSAIIPRLLARLGVHRSGADPKPCAGFGVARSRSSCVSSAWKTDSGSALAATGSRLRNQMKRLFHCTDLS